MTEVEDLILSNQLSIMTALQLIRYQLFGDKNILYELVKDNLDANIQRTRAFWDTHPTPPPH